jgi:hypothetical protein
MPARGSGLQDERHECGIVSAARVERDQNATGALAQDKRAAEAVLA